MPGYKEPQEKTTAEAIFPQMTTDETALPPLVRRDGQDLSTGEVVYPAMGYDGEVYQPWPVEAVARANRLYPDRPEKVFLVEDLDGETDDILLAEPGKRPRLR